MSGVLFRARGRRVQGAPGGRSLDGTHSETGNHVRVSGHEVWDLGDGVIRTSRGYYHQQEYDRQVSGGAGAG
jgi:hypothetical protein